MIQHNTFFQAIQLIYHNGEEHSLMGFVGLILLAKILHTSTIKTTDTTHREAERLQSFFPATKTTRSSISKIDMISDGTFNHNRERIVS